MDFCLDKCEIITKCLKYIMLRLIKQLLHTRHQNIVLVIMGNSLQSYIKFHTNSFVSFQRKSLKKICKISHFLNLDLVQKYP